MNFVYPSKTEQKAKFIYTMLSEIPEASEKNLENYRKLGWENG